MTPKCCRGLRINMLPEVPGWGSELDDDKFRKNRRSLRWPWSPRLKDLRILENNPSVWVSFRTEDCLDSWQVSFLLFVDFHLRFRGGEKVTGASISSGSSILANHSYTFVLSSISRSLIFAGRYLCQINIINIWISRYQVVNWASSFYCKENDKLSTNFVVLSSLSSFCWSVDTFLPFFQPSYY